MQIFEVKYEKLFFLSVRLNILAIIIFCLLIVGVKLIISKGLIKLKRTVVINEISLGIGKYGSVKMLIDESDRRLAYQIWIELSTRKIGIPFDVENDVIIEVYNSWYEFFNTIRKEIKNLPIQYIKKDENNLVNISIELLNEGLRPHLTKWQARFRKWYAEAIEHDGNLELSPQEIQKQFPDFTELVQSIMDTNNIIIRYKELLYNIAFSKKKET